MCLRACTVWPLSHRTSINNRSFHTRECTRFHEKTSASVRFCCRSGPPTKYLNVWDNRSRNGGQSQTSVSFHTKLCNISPTLRESLKECCFFLSCEKGLIRANMVKQQKEGVGRGRRIVGTLMRRYRKLTCSKLLSFFGYYKSTVRLNWHPVVGFTGTLLSALFRPFLVLHFLFILLAWAYRPCIQAPKKHFAEVMFCSLKLASQMIWSVRWDIEWIK